MRNVVSCLVVVMMLVVPGRAPGQAPKAPNLDLVAKFVDQTAIGVVRIDVARVDTDAVINDVARTLSDFMREKDQAALGVADQQLKDAREKAKHWRERFAAAGGREIYVVIVFNPAADPPLIGVVPTGPGAKTTELIELLKDLPMGAGGRVVEGGIVTGPESLTGGMPLAEPARRDEIERELKRAEAGAGDAPIQLGLIPAEFVRRAVAENVTELPAELGGGPSTVLTKGVISGSGSLMLAPNWSLKVVLQSESEEAAQALAATLKKGVQHSSERAGPELGPELAKALTPRAEGSTVIIAIGNERMASLKRALVPSMLAARKAARRMIVATNMRSGVIGCLMYAQDHNDQWPKDFDTLVREGILNQEMLVNPERPEMKPGYSYIQPDSELLKKTNWSEHVVMYEAYKEWPKEGVWVAFADGHVHIVTVEAEMKRLLEYAMKNKAK